MQIHNKSMPRQEIARGQDWNIVTFTPQTTEKKPQRPPPPTTSRGVNVSKLEETEELRHERVPPNVRVALQQARAAKGLTQRQLALQLSLPVQTIVEYENGKAIPNNALIARFERTLGAKLPRT